MTARYTFWERLTAERDIAGGRLFPRCTGCRTRMLLFAPPLLTLLPVYSDHDYTPSAEYYRRHLTPIRQTADIPVARRACRLWPLYCPVCGARAVLATDFLPVRGQEVPEKATVCQYEPLADLFAAPPMG